MNSFILALLDIIIVSVGYIYFYSFKERCNFYKDVVLFSKSLNNLVGIQNLTILNAIQSFSFTKERYKEKLLSCLEEKDNTHLEEREINKIFNLIGNSFGEQTQQHIKNFENFAQEKHNEQVKLQKEKGELYFKLSLLLAAAFTILIL